MIGHGIKQVTVPLPFWNDHVHCYIAYGTGRWTIIDTGMKTKDTCQRWNQVFREYKIDPEHDIEQILITHHHPDHFEFAEKLQRMTNTHVYLSAKELKQATNKLSQEENDKFYKESGMPFDLIRQLKPVNQLSDRLPCNLRTIKENDAYQIGDLLFEAINMPGHSDEHICFYNEGEGILFSGDHLTKEITPYISYHGSGDENPLGTYLKTLRNMQMMNISLVLPGHGPIFEDAQERIEELLKYFERQLEKAKDKVNRNTAYQISRVLMPDAKSSFEQWIAVGETNAYLRYLVDCNEVNVDLENGQMIYKV